MDKSLPRSDSAASFWASVLDRLSKELSEQSFKTWVEPLQPISWGEGRLCLGVPDAFFGKWLRDHYLGLIQSTLREVAGADVEVIFVVKESDGPTSAPPAPSPAQPARQKSSSPSRNPSVDLTSESALHGRYTFDDFVVGPGNRFAHAASVAISEAPAKNYNPLFIHGPTGLGKTHLMQSIAHETKRRHPGFKILYISSEKFTNQLISAIQTRTTSQFRARYRSLDLILIDDIHFLADKEATQEEFFHTFNTLYDAHKQIVVSSDRPPREIPGLEERLVSRFGWGLVTDIQPPDFETRVAILKKKMEKEIIGQVPDDVSFFIASQFRSNVRELEGALVRVVAYGTLSGKPIDLALAKQVLRDSVEEEGKKINIDQIQRLVAQYFGIDVSDLRSKKRTKSIAEPRQVAMYLIRTLTSHSFPEIGEYFGGRDHTTVLHAFQKVSKDVEKNPKKLRVVEELRDMLKTSS